MVGLGISEPSTVSLFYKRWIRMEFETLVVDYSSSFYPLVLPTPDQGSVSDLQI